MAFGGIKDYNLIHLDFRNQTYQVYHYKKDRRLTARLAWIHIKNNKADITGTMPSNATIFEYENIIKEHNFNKKYCDRYSSFNGFN